MNLYPRPDYRPRATKIRRRAWWPTAAGWRAAGYQPADPMRPRIRLTEKARKLLEGCE